MRPLRALVIGATTVALVLGPGAAPTVIEGASGSARAADQQPSDHGGTSRSASLAAASSPGRSDPPPIKCGTDLSLARSPDVAYNFFCTQDGRPVGWSTTSLRLYVSGLSAVQTSALDAALPQWERAAHFSVVYATRRAAADVTIIGGELPSSSPGLTEDGYTTVTYTCTPWCAYQHANVVLSSQADFSSSEWVSTILHELGHVAGLNHVSRQGSVMYPYVTDGAPVTYTAGERAGLAILAARHR